MLMGAPAPPGPSKPPATAMPMLKSTPQLHASSRASTCSAHPLITGQVRNSGTLEPARRVTLRSMQASATSSSRPHHCPERRAGSSSSAHTMTGWHLLTPEFRDPHVLPAGKFLLCQKGFSPFSPGEGLGTLCRGNISTSLHQTPPRARGVHRSRAVSVWTSLFPQRWALVPCSPPCP